MVKFIWFGMIITIGNEIEQSRYEKSKEKNIDIIQFCEGN